MSERPPALNSKFETDIRSPSGELLGPVPLPVQYFTVLAAAVAACLTLAEMVKGRLVAHLVAAT